MKFFRITDPITRKRLSRFRSIKRAYVSLWLLVLLYIISLGAELICNDRPLFIRYKGKSFFPALKFYPESTFVPGGGKTRANYKSLAQSPAFAQDAGNTMIFAPVRFGPLESIEPESLQDEKRVTLKLRPIPHVGNVNVQHDFTILRSREAGYFFGKDPNLLRGVKVTQHWRLNQEFRVAIARRFRNEDAAPMDLALNATGSDLPAILSLSKYTSRSRAPRSVRITFREPFTDQDAAAVMTFNSSGEITGTAPPQWMDLSKAQREAFQALAIQRFQEPVYPSPITANGKQCAVDVDLNEIAWPYRPVRGHWLGIDNAGRDVLSRLLYGLRISMTFGFVLVLLSMTIGVVMGAIQGYFGGVVDIIGQRLVEIWSAIPFLYVMILLGSVYGRSFGLLLFCYAIFNWIGISYYMRAEFLRLRGQAYVDAARCLGVRTPRIMARHILPNAITPVITFIPFSLVGAIGSLAALDYLGFGLPPPTPSWGEMLQQAQQIRWAWWLILYPSLALFVVMLLGVFIGEGVREAFDPRKYSRLQ